MKPDERMAKYRADHPLTGADLRTKRQRDARILKRLKRAETMLRMHLINGRSYTFIGKKFGVTRQRVQQILKKMTTVEKGVGK